MLILVSQTPPSTTLNGFSKHPQTYKGAGSGSNIPLHLGAELCIVCIHAELNTFTHIHTHAPFVPQVMWYTWTANMRKSLEEQPYNTGSINP